MRMRCLFVLAMAFCPGVLAQADGLVQRLPEDGAWARYTLKHTAEPSPEGMLTIASVGQEKVKGESCRWLELVIEVKWKGQKQLKEIHKGLIPEKHLKKGENPRLHWVKGWVKLRDQEPQRLTPELLSLPQLKLNLFVSAPWQETKMLPKKTITTKLGDLRCEGISGHLVLKDAAVNVKNGTVTKRDMKLRMQSYFHDKAPFGVAWLESILETPGAEKAVSLREVLILHEVGIGAKSQLPELK